MIIADEPIEVNNFETLLEYLEEKQERPCNNSFLELSEEILLDENTYNHMQFRKYR